MKISNVRLGFAANSSSTHSIIFGLDAPSDEWRDGDFGWNEFCCNDLESKKHYLAVTLYNNLSHLGHNIAACIAKHWTSTKQDLHDWNSGYSHSYIDHQSLMGLPIDPITEQVDMQFFRELTSFYLRDDVAIVGGNDNGPPTRFVEGRQKHIVPTECMKVHTCRKDPKTGYWTLFNRRNGTKIRMHFDDNAPDYSKAFAPELVDIKITDYCPYGCSYCYQGSTVNGKHAEPDWLSSIAYAFREMGVFEVALGGGETTMHPSFTRIVESFANNGVVPNITTFDLKWLNNPEICDVVKKHVGKVALSVDSPEQVKQAQAIMGANGLRDKIAFQIVMGTVSMSTVEKILEATDSWSDQTVLLGFKKNGRGEEYKPLDYSNWLEVVSSENHEFRKIGIDTALAQQTGPELLEKVDRKLVTFEEGKFSMYVDAVEKKMAPSSYCDEKEYIELPERRCLHESILEGFAKF